MAKLSKGVVPFTGSSRNFVAELQSVQLDVLCEKFPQADCTFIHAN